MYLPSFANQVQMWRAIVWP